MPKQFIALPYVIQDLGEADIWTYCNIYSRLEPIAQMAYNGPFGI